jgi:hypothetical protein
VPHQPAFGAIESFRRQMHVSPIAIDQRASCRS